MKELFIFLSLFLLVSPVFASTGLSVSPATGTFIVDPKGGDITFTIFNTGNELAEYSLSVGEDGKNFTEFEEYQFEIKGDSYKNIIAHIKPHKAGFIYPLTVSVGGHNPSEGGMGLGLMVVSKINVNYLHLCPAEKCCISGGDYQSKSCSELNYNDSFVCYDNSDFRAKVGECKISDEIQGENYLKNPLLLGLGLIVFLVIILIKKRKPKTPEIE